LSDGPSLVAAAKEEWSNQSLCKVNDSIVRLGMLHGGFHWQKHDREDELFFVLSGRLLVAFEGKTFALDPHQGSAVPKGFVHRTRATERTAVLMVGRASVKPRGRLFLLQLFCVREKLCFDYLLAL
jgi:mannose-6-phosphate isomerase-like protein (cupin superfamily)